MKNEFSKADPPNFVLTCRMLGTIDIGEKSFPINIDALDAWMMDNAPAPESVATYTRRRQAAVEAFVRDDMDAMLQHVEDMHQLIHMLRALPMARAGAKAGQAQALRRKGQTKLTESQQRAVVREYHAAAVKYGMLKALARKYDVSDDTVRATIDRFK